MPESRRVYITVLDKSVDDNENAEAWQDFLQEIEKKDNDP
jgi:hypothetical protein